MRRTLTLHRLGLTNQSNRREIILSKVNALEVKEHPRYQLGSSRLLCIILWEELDIFRYLLQYTFQGLILG